MDMQALKRSNSCAAATENLPPCDAPSPCTQSSSSSSLTLSGGTAPISLVCISDLHALPLPALPPGDVLLIAGDLSEGRPAQLFSRLAVLNDLTSRFQYIILIAGNHDRALSHFCDSRDAAQYDDLCQRIALRGVFYIARSKRIIYLENTGVTLTVRGRKIRVWGSPCSLATSKQTAFGYSSQQAQELWAQVPEGTDILLTHGPPLGYLDNDGCAGKNLGCIELTKALWRVRPRAHVFGHVHAGYGTAIIRYDEVQKQYEQAVAKKNEIHLETEGRALQQRAGRYVPPSQRRSQAGQSSITELQMPVEMTAQQSRVARKQGIRLW
ncbi:Metallo-dependent phosphatase-like protein [Kalaharituber pfeilii]|nr:Metallo-dependent phosphatase-like protein [Kalaharituber pfeilii]